MGYFIVKCEGVPTAARDGKLARLRRKIFGEYVIQYRTNGDAFVPGLGWSDHKHQKMTI